MWRYTHSLLILTLSLVIPIGSLTLVGCSKNEAPSDTAASPPGDVAKPGMMGGPGRSGPGGGGPGGGRAARFAPVAATATSAEIFQQKCQGCHGPQGEGARGPSLLKVSDDPDAKLFKTIHEGKGRMPAFGKQMTEAQMNELVTYVKQLGAKK